jgi:hypothetical protein
MTIARPGEEPGLALMASQSLVSVLVSHRLEPYLCNSIVLSHPIPDTEDAAPSCTSVTRPVKRTCLRCTTNGS